MITRFYPYPEIHNLVNLRMECTGYDNFTVDYPSGFVDKAQILYYQISEKLFSPKSTGIIVIDYL